MRFLQSLALQPRFQGPIIRAMSQTTEQISLSVNGEALQVPTGTTLAGLVTIMELDTRKLAVERNLEIVPRSQYAATLLTAGDTLEIVHFVGGG
jgi:thiamine biosynthesis protein ThiS